MTFLLLFNDQGIAALEVLLDERVLHLGKSLLQLPIFIFATHFELGDKEKRRWEINVAREHLALKRGGPAFRFRPPRRIVAKPSTPSR